jgi:3-oxoacyl-[acyl-carrier protein] reductase
MNHFTDLNGKRALVTGASQGIGRCIAEAFGACGAEVAVHYRGNEEMAGDVVRAIDSTGGKGFAVQADLGDGDSIRRLAEEIAGHWDALDLLVNNAGDMVARSRLAEADDALMEKVLKLNLTGCIDVTRRLIPLLERGNEPAIINLTSIAAYSGGQGGVSLYASAKGGMVALTRSLAQELGPAIRVNGIAPGVIITNIHRDTTPEMLERVAGRTALGRNGRPEECVGAALLLAGPAGSFITGEIIHVNGGLWMA